LPQTLQEELKKANQELNIRAAPEAVIRIMTMVEDNEFLKAMKDEILRYAERLALVKQKCEALAVAQEPHKDRQDEI
ncbi:hypothetical protein KI387_026481, partial [Taxus chinensis]